MEKELWKWILESFSDEGIANVGHNLGIKIPGFRQINPQQKNFKILRQKLIQEASHPRNANHLREFFQSLAEETPDFQQYRGKTIEELLQSIEEEIPPSMLFSALLTSGDEEDAKKANEIFNQLTAENRLDELERKADLKAEDADETDLESQLKQLQEELKQAQQKILNFEKKMKKSEQKNEELKTKATTAKAAFEHEKKQMKDEKKALQQEIQALKGENGSLKNQLAAFTPEKESLRKKVDQQTADLTKKNDEIARLNALLLKLRTEQDKEPKEREHDVQPVPVPAAVEKIKVAVIGDPKNTRVQRYKKFDLTIIEASEIKEEKNNNFLHAAEQIWLLTYKTPRSIQKRVRNLVQEKPIQEFATFIDLENYMMKG